MSFWGELRRRNVYKVGAAYALVAWIVAQLVSVVNEPLALPDGFDAAVLVLLAIGFPVALLLAWAYELTPAGIRRTVDVPRNESTTRDTGRKLNFVLMGLVAGAVVGTGSTWLLGRDVDGEWLREEAIPELEAFIEQGNWEAAFALAAEAEARLGENPDLAEIWPRVSGLTTIESDPPGATVYRRGYEQSDDQWQVLGQTPIEDARMPFGLSRIRLELDGFVTLDRTIGSGVLAPRLGRYQGGSLAMTVPSFNYRLDRRETLPAGKVRVPAWTEALAGEPTAFDDFFLDRTEVTNAEFREFVDAGGYERAELWEPVIRDGAPLDFAAAMSLFVDRTGRPGPSTWSGGDFPAEQDAFPVSGVSWYEAKAYARFMGQELPTLYHWRRGWAMGEALWLLAASNLRSDGPRDVDDGDAMSYVGAYDMTGNVREWTSTETGDGQRVITGGSWNDEPFVAAQAQLDLPGTAPPLDRSPGNGFRLVITTDEADVRARAATPFQRESMRETVPVDDATFAVLGEAFSYDRTALNAEIDSAAEIRTRLWTRERITFDPAYGGERMVLYLYLPNGSTPPYQTVVLWPTGGAYFPTSTIDTYGEIKDFFVADGRALAVPVYSGTFERKRDRNPFSGEVGTAAYRDAMVDGVKDLSRSIDYLETRADIDTGSLAYFGHSQGGVQAPVVLTREARFRVAIVYVGFIPSPDLPAAVDPVHALPRIDVPVLMLSGEFDSTAPLPVARQYFDLIGTPEPDKKHVVAPGGHFVPNDVLIRESLDWLDMYLGPVRRPLMSSSGPGR